MHSTDAQAPRSAATWRDYVSIARPDHWAKHIFIVPGLVLAFVLRPAAPLGLLLPIVFGFASACAIASANYVLNEWLDAEFDRFHPVKSQRPAVQRQLDPRLVLLEYAVLAVGGLLLASTVSRLFMVTSCAFLASGLIYNVRPLRTKDRVYLDVLTEAINNPIRLVLGWAMVAPDTLPPSSLVAAYWMGGAFLMATKRFAEYRAVAATDRFAEIGLYRRSFVHYTENRLLVSAFLYAQMAAFFLAVFLIKYRVEYLLSMPLFAALFAVYLRIGLKRESTAQAPEKLFREKGLMAILALLVVALVILTLVDIPSLERLTDPHYIEVPSGDVVPAVPTAV
ncbi:MAG: UbiA prenyltransferase family protein [Acidobacteriota bacterium]